MNKPPYFKSIIIRDEKKHNAASVTLRPSGSEGGHGEWRAQVFEYGKQGPISNINFKNHLNDAIAFVFDEFYKIAKIDHICIAGSLLKNDIGEFNDKGKYKPIQKGKYINFDILIINKNDRWDVYKSQINKELHPSDKLNSFETLNDAYQFANSYVYQLNVDMQDVKTNGKNKLNNKLDGQKDI